MKSSFSSIRACWQLSLTAWHAVLLLVCLKRVRLRFDEQRRRTYTDGPEQLCSDMKDCRKIWGYVNARLARGDKRSISIPSRAMRILETRYQIMKLCKEKAISINIPTVQRQNVLPLSLVFCKVSNGYALQSTNCAS